MFDGTTDIMYHEVTNFRSTELSRQFVGTPVGVSVQYSGTP